MDEKISKVNDESMKEVAGGIYIPPKEPRKSKVGDRVRSLSRPDWGVGVVVDLHNLTHGYACSVAFDKKGDMLYEKDLILAD